MKILIADTFPGSHVTALKNRGHQITFDPDLEADALDNAIGENEILIVRGTAVRASTLENGKALRLVVRAGAGTNSIDKVHAAKANVRVCNVPGANATAVAELVMGLIIAIDRNIESNACDLKAGIWNKKKYSRAKGLHGQNIGILGLGAVGLAVAERARAFGMKIYAVHKPDRLLETERRIRAVGITQVRSLEELLPVCDIVSLHMPLAQETKRMVNESFLDKMKAGAIFINTSRGDLVDETALIQAMDSKGIRAGLDVYNDEPGTGIRTFESKLARHKRVCGTHHIGASTEQAQNAVADGVMEIIQSYENGDLKYCVNN
ncbi:MAG: NAD(P)-binding domain-containing protein [Gammaproteobacteria bacterium]|nr:NAD(P)-binding domain-containing protein [Gammaproteobacteria bacterium]